MCKNVNENSIVCSMTTPLENLIVMVYLYNFHWRVLKIDVENCTLNVLDPYGENFDEKRVVKAFKEFLTHCQPKSSFYQLKNCNWKITKIGKRPIQKKKKMMDQVVVLYAHIIQSV